MEGREPRLHAPHLIVLVSRRPEFVAYLAGLCDGTADLRLAGCVDTLVEAAEVLRRWHRPRRAVAIALDDPRAIGDIPRAADILGDLAPAVRVVCLGTRANRPSPLPLAAIFVAARAPPSMWLAALRAAAGQPPRTRSARSRTHDGSKREVLRLAALGLRNEEIARRLFLAEGTVRYHLRHLFEQLGAGSRTELVHLARAAGLLAE